jgi:Putative peptidoglycan binding domain
MVSASMNSRTLLRRVAVLVFAVLVASAGAPRAHADGMGRGLGAMQGAIIGDMIGGSGGAAAGAAIGAMIGAQGQVSREQEYLDRQKAGVDARLAQWEANQQERELAAREREERAAYLEALGSGVDLDLLLDVQTELMHRGYDIGVVGMQSAELTTAIVRYQESQGLVPNGAITAGLLDQMREDGQ